MSVSGLRADAPQDIRDDPPSLTTAWGLVAGLAMMSAGAWYGHTAIVLLGALVTALGLVGRLWSALSLVGVRAERGLSRSRVFAGDSVRLSLRVENRKPLPLSWLRLEERLPESLRPDRPDEDGAATGDGIGFSTPLGAYRSATYSRSLLCRRRGFYAIGPTLLVSGDIFGLFERSRVGGGASRLIVYPRLFEMADLGLPSQYPLGDARDPARRFEDPNRPEGLRDYTPDTPFKAIAWSASARQGRLQAKTFETTTTLRVAIFLAVDTFAAGTEEGEAFELAVSAAASLGHRLIESRQPVGLYANGHQADGAGAIVIGAGRGEDQARAMLEALARIGQRPTMAFADFLARNADALAGRATLCVIAAGLSREALAHLSVLHHAGHAITVLIAGSGALPKGPFATRRLTMPEAAR